MNKLIIAVLTASLFCTQTKTAATTDKYHHRPTITKYLFKAIQAKKVHSAEEHLRSGAKINKATNFLNIPIYDREQLDAKFNEGSIHDQFDIEAKSEYCYTTPIHEAASTNCPEMIAMLLNRGADAGYHNKEFGTALHNLLKPASIGSHALTICKMLLQAGVHVNAGKTTMNITALHMIARAEISDDLAIPLIMQLLEAGADTTIKTRCETPKTPAEWALTTKRKEIIETYRASR